MKSISLDKINSIKVLLKNGSSVRQVSRTIGLSVSTVAKYRRLCCTNLENDKGGRPPILSPTTKNMYKIKMLSGNLKTAIDVRNALKTQ